MDQGVRELCLSVRLAGERPAAILQGHEFFTVFAVFRRSLYLQADSGPLLCLGSDELEAGPLNALCPDWPPEDTLPEPGWNLRREGRELIGQAAHAAAYFPLRMRIRCDAMEIWKPAPFPQVKRESLRAVLGRMSCSLPAMPSEGLAPLLAPMLLAFVRGRLPGPSDLPEFSHQAVSPQQALVRQAGKGLEQLGRWLAGQTKSPDAGVSALLGLGPGLTPSGDDALAGVMLALHALGQDAQCEALSQEIDRLAPSATNSISRAHLAAAARGLASAPVHHALCAVMRGEPEQEDLRRLDGVGHSSGWDAFTGVILALGALSAEPWMHPSRQGPE